MTRNGKWRTHPVSVMTHRLIGREFGDGRQLNHRKHNTDVENIENTHNVWLLPLKLNQLTAQMQLEAHTQVHTIWSLLRH